MMLRANDRAIVGPEKRALRIRRNPRRFSVFRDHALTPLLSFWVASFAGYALPSLFLARLSSEDPGRELFLALLSGAVLATAFTASWAVVFALPYPVRTNSPAALTAVAGVALVVMNVLFTFADLFIWSLNNQCCVFDMRWVAGRLIGLPWAVFFIGSALVFRRGLADQEEARDARIRSARLSAELARLRLELLDNQLRPHFLFNTLQSIATLVHRDRAGAAVMLRQLTTLLRCAVSQSARHEIALEEEVATLKLYASIERVRFQNLQVVFHIPESTRRASVPYLLLQPLVENSIRHTVAQSVSGRVEVRSALMEGGSILVLSVVDDGRGMLHAPDRTRTQVGLANVRNRLRVLYGTEAELDIFRSENGGFTVQIQMPFHQASQV